MENPTKLLYFEDTYLFKSQAAILDVQQQEGQIQIILDQTIFYPQGGGQPADHGIISTENGTFQVTMVQFHDGQVHHIGHFTTGQFAIGETVKLQIDAARRIANAKAHSAGHLIDVALAALGHNFPPIRGHHFPGECYVSYHGTTENVEALKAQLEAKINDLISQKIPIHKKIISTAELFQYCGKTEHNVPAGKPCRVVYAEGFLGCPCGGTHLNNTAEITAFTIRKIKVKNGEIKISYDAT